MQETLMSRSIAHSISKMIELESLAVGTRLPSERELALRFGVSRQVVRQAEQLLEAAGKLDIRRGSGVYVCDKRIQIGFNLPKVTAFGLTQTRLMFESECAALAATVITEDQISTLEKTIEAMASAPLGSPEADTADHDFHLQIAKATGNESNVVILQNIWRMRNEIDAVKRVYLAVGHKDSSDRVNEHIEVMDALRNRDPIAARKSMRAHFSRLLDALIDASEEHDIADVRRKSSENRERYMHRGVIN